MKKAFTLAEVLIALALLGVVAAFTIPKIMQTQNEERYNTMAKEFAGNISEAFQLYQKDNPVTANTRLSDLMARMNIIGPDTTSVIDLPPNWPYGTTAACSDPSTDCYKLANGAVVISNKGMRFGPMNLKPHLTMGFDPDGRLSSSKQVSFCLSATGKMTTVGYCPTDITWSDNFNDGIPQYSATLGSITPQSKVDPTWFHW